MQPNVVGTSLDFPQGAGHHAMQLMLPLQSAPGYHFSISLTRTTPWFPQSALGGEGDWAPIVLMGDGSTMMGGVYGDNQGGLAFNCVQASCEGDRTFNTLFAAPNVATLGTLLIDITFQLDPLSTSIFMSFSGASTGSGNFTFNTPLNKDSLVFTLLDDGDANAAFRLNSLSITATPVPAALPLFATGLAILGVIAWRRKRRGGREVSL